jgi:hypothetical protein
LRPVLAHLITAELEWASGGDETKRAALQQFLAVFSHYLVRINRGEAEHQFIELPTGVDYLQLSFVLKGQCSEVAREERAGDTPPLPVRGQD